MSTPTEYPASFSWFANSSLAVTIPTYGGIEEWRDAFESWCELNPDEVHTYAILAPVQRWLATLTVADRNNHPELLAMGAYKLVTEYGF